MESLHERLIAARTKVNVLLEERAQSAKAMETLESHARERAREADVLRARIQELEQENEVLRTAKVPDEGAGREGTKEKIDELVNEIDRCLALLNN